MGELSHLDETGAARMVDIGDKPVSARRAQAEAWLLVDPAVERALDQGSTPKGNVFETARIAGVLAAKRTAELIPLCHGLALDHVKIDFERQPGKIRILAQAATRSATGVEMEALTACSVAGLTLYDMLTALSKTMVLDGLRLPAKSGGRPGDYHAGARAPCAALPLPPPPRGPPSPTAAATGKRRTLPDRRSAAFSRPTSAPSSRRRRSCPTKRKRLSGS